MTALTLRNGFERQCEGAVALADQVEEALTPQGGRLPPFQRTLVFETAFLRVMLGWESFLEDIFLHYLCGRTGINGASFTTLVTPRSIDAARDVIVGDQEYVEWSTRDTIKKRTEKWLGTSTVFLAGLDRVPDLKQMHRVRNRIAHSSSKAKADFALARIELVPGHDVFYGFGAGMVLRHVRGNGQRNLDRFVRQLENAATDIAEGPPP